MKMENRRRNGSFMAASTIIWNWIRRDGCVNWIFNRKKMKKRFGNDWQTLKRKMSWNWMNCREMQWLRQWKMVFWLSPEVLVPEKPRRSMPLFSILRWKAWIFFLRHLREEQQNEWRRQPAIRHLRFTDFWNCREWWTIHLQQYILNETRRIRWRQMWSLSMRCRWWIFPWCMHCFVPYRWEPDWFLWVMSISCRVWDREGF